MARIHGQDTAGAISWGRESLSEILILLKLRVVDGDQMPTAFLNHWERKKLLL